MTSAPIQTSRDWLGSVHADVLAWWMPKAAILGGFFVPVSFRAVIWIIALIWMGTACILNARRCHRTHCRYTGPYYLAMIMPVMALGAGLVTVGTLGWVWLGLIILGGSGLIWWATEQVSARMAGHKPVRPAIVVTRKTPLRPSAMAMFRRMLALVRLDRSTPWKRAS